MLVKKHLFELSFSSGPSMLPTVNVSGDLFIVRKYRSGEKCAKNISVGDGVVFISPADPYKPLFKRLIGVPGDEVCVDPRLPEGKRSYITVPKGHIWVHGDNLTYSYDSRTLGPIPIGLLKGKVLCRILPNITVISNTLKELKS